MSELAAIERLGVAISDAGVAWSAEMRAAWELADKQDRAARSILQTIERALQENMDARLILGEGSPIRDAMRELGLRV